MVLREGERSRGREMKVTTLFILLTSLLQAQTFNVDVTFRKVVDGSAATATKPFRDVASDPATCSPGEKIFNHTTALFKSCLTTNTWTAEGTGGSGTNLFSDLTSCKVTNTSTVATITAPCAISINGIYTSIAASNATATLSGSASGSAYIYARVISSVMTLVVGHNSANTITCANCTTVTGITAFPVDSMPIAKLDFASSAYTTLTDYRAILSRIVLSCINGVTCTPDAFGQLVVDGSGATPAVGTPPFYLSSYANSGAGFAMSSANKTSFTPFVLESSKTISKTTFVLVTACPGACGVKIGIFDAAGNPVTGASTATMTNGGSPDMGSTATAKTVSFASSFTLSPNVLYYYAITTDNTTVSFLNTQEATSYQHVELLMNSIGGVNVVGYGNNGSGSGASVALPATKGTITATLNLYALFALGN